MVFLVLLFFLVFLVLLVFWVFFDFPYGFSVRFWWRVMKYCSSLVFLLSVGLESLEILLSLGFFWFFNSDKRQRKCTPTVPHFEKKQLNPKNPKALKTLKALKALQLLKKP